MKIVAIISQKGGAGKTTLAVHLATAAAAAGYIAAVIDLDPQATAASWGDRRAAAAPEVISGQAARLPALVSAAQQNGADFLGPRHRPQCRPGGFPRRAGSRPSAHSMPAGRVRS